MQQPQCGVLDSPQVPRVSLSDKVFSVPSTVSVSLHKRVWSKHREEGWSSAFPGHTAAISDSPGGLGPWSNSKQRHWAFSHVNSLMPCGFFLPIHQQSACECIRLWSYLYSCFLWYSSFKCFPPDLLFDMLDESQTHNLKITLVSDNPIEKDLPHQQQQNSYNSACNILQKRPSQAAASHHDKAEKQLQFLFQPWPAWTCFIVSISAPVLGLSGELKEDKRNQNTSADLSIVHFPFYMSLQVIFWKFCRIIWNRIISDESCLEEKLCFTNIFRWKSL